MSSRPSDLVRDSKLDARFVSGATHHVYYLSSQTSRQRRIRTEDTWHRRRELGNGTYGRVWLEGCVSGSKIGQLRAVKEIPKEKSTSSHVDYARELEAMAKFSHEKYVHCFVKSYGWYETAETVFIAMEYLEHGDLQKHLLRPIGEKEAKEITKQLVEGITFMHSEGFAHRDLKPANILVLHSSPDWWVKIGDFGISKRCEEGITALRSRIGTQGYLAPEVIGLYPINEDAPTDTERASYTFAVDIWSLGEIVFRMIANKPAFPEPRHLYNYVVKGHDFPSFISITGETSSDCRNFIEKTMAPSARLRLTGQEAATHPWIQPSRPSSRASSARSSRLTDPTTLPSVGSLPDHRLSNPSLDDQFPLVGTAQWTTLGPEDLTAQVQVTEKPSAPSVVTNLARSANLPHTSSLNPSFVNQDDITLDDIPRIVAAEQAREQRPYRPPGHIAASSDPLSYSGGSMRGSAIPMPPHNALAHNRPDGPDMDSPRNVPEGVDAPSRSPRRVSPHQTVTDSKESIKALYQKDEPRTPFAMRRPVLSEDSENALSSRPATPSRVAFGAPHPAIGNGEPLASVRDARSADQDLSSPTFRQSRAQRRKGPGGLLQNIYSVFQTSQDRSAPTTPQPDPKPGKTEDPLSHSILEPEQIQELIGYCTDELKARALDIPFFLLPFRPTSDPIAVRGFLRNYFLNAGLMFRERLKQALQMTEPMVISGIIKWCWSRLEGGVVGWDAYELFKAGEMDSNWARDSFQTFIPLAVDNECRSKIIFDFFDLLAAVAAHSKVNGFGGRKLSRMAAWWAFQQGDTGSGFHGGYKAWLMAADATSHLFFAYLRSLSLPPHISGISVLPMSLQKLLQETEYPPVKPALMQTTTTRIAMNVDTISPTPLALVRRGAPFEYHGEDGALREFSEFEDPVQALTYECRRVLQAISAANQTQPPFVSTAKDASWSRFEDLGFSNALVHDWELHNSRSESNNSADSDALVPGSLASLTTFDLDDAFWWVWMNSLAPEETNARKLAFGRCVVMETVIRTSGWFVIEEFVKGGGKELEPNTPRKKSFMERFRANSTTTINRTSIGPDQQARIQAAAQMLQAKQRHEQQFPPQDSSRRDRADADVVRDKTTGVFTLQPAIMSQGSPALTWASKYDKEAIRAAYLSDTNAGRDRS